MNRGLESVGEIGGYRMEMEQRMLKAGTNGRVNEREEHDNWAFG